MKRFISILLLGILVFLLFNCSEDSSTEPPTIINIDEAEQILLSKVFNDTVPTSKRVYKLSNILEKDSVILCGNNQYVADRDCWLFFIDDFYIANWGHPCRYIFIYHSQVSDNDLIIIDENMPPRNLENFVEVDF
ncbi:MAG: hypothetical protein PF638_03785 [Candidatus Delongbacteria bacterium]|jgi:hypothetical protein|nr:hypothetical protein [Candidatus Delongbacteria bacterium]